MKAGLVIVLLAAVGLGFIFMYKELQSANCDNSSCYESSNGSKQ